MTNQEVFDFGYNAILKQGRPSYDKETTTCYYRHPNGIDKCVAGHFITDDEYRPEFEGLTCSNNSKYGSYFEDEMIVQRLFEHKNIDLDLIGAMQIAHDEMANYPKAETFEESWRIEMSKVAKEFGLQGPPTP